MLQISHLPNNPGVYFFKNKSGRILYIGKAKDIKKRVSQYFNKDIGVWKQDMVNKSSHVDFLTTNTDQEAYILENNLIKRYQPVYNTLLKGDNSYTYIKITNEEFPQIFFTRFKNNDGAIYIGPKVYKKDLKQLLQVIKYFFKIRACNKTQFKKGKLCDYYSFGMCDGWCNTNNEKLENTNAKKMYDDYIDKIQKFFQGDTKVIENEIVENINKSIQNQNFEWAAKLRDVLYTIQKHTQKQTIELQDNTTGYFLKIKKIGEYYAFSALKFFNGKLIDVLKFTEHSSGASFGQLKTEFQNEFGRIYNYDKTEEKFFGGTISGKNMKTDVINNLSDILDNSIESLIINSTFSKKNVMGELLTNLQNRYFLDNYPYKMECIDISHIGGDYISGGLSCLVGGIPDKKFYRMYKINTIQNGKSDDYLAIKEVLIRRFKNDRLPDLFVIDGGKGQLNILKKLIKENQKIKQIYEKVDFLSIGKGKARTKTGKNQGEKEIVFYLDQDLNIKQKTFSYDDTDRVLIKLRDESHRFANKYRKKRMSKEWQS
ncbi:GIY-YIG nuclease family protein [Candidatus Absconditicoccus praedator]|uniref:GIY-YIG nuclease family protein n=1 Tax=Candidatus Absconditicoccus praedator TaxID=2735562 RepID=UPI001E5D113E|nr:GIY-YIG nuclease family protein [Candidatus Absconditicoccus praedator]UFX82612.1 GIY-YIG nuclease family protein [Candidatus Absconditicoccus praedator]